MRRAAHLRTAPRAREPWRDPITHGTIGEWAEPVAFIIIVLVMVRVLAWVAYVTQ